MAADPLGPLFDRYRHEGDLAALARVVETVAPELLRLARTLRPRGQSPEDLVQATFLAALTHSSRYDSNRPIRPWLFGILLNKAAGGRRAEFELAMELPDRDSTADDAEAAEAAHLLARGLERLPPIYSEVLRDHFFAGMSPGEIARRHGRPSGTVRAQLHRGLRLLRALVPTGLAGKLLWLGLSRSSLLRIRREVLEQAAVDSASISVHASDAPFAHVRVLAGFAVVAAIGLGLREWSSGPLESIAPDPAHGASERELTSKSTGSRRLERRALDEEQTPEPSENEDGATDGRLLVRVLFSDGSPAAGVGVRLHAWGELSWRDNRTDGVTDAAGEFAVERIHAGRVGIYCDRGGDQGFGATVTVGEQTIREVELPPGVDVSGEVVDERGIPVSHAGVWLSESALPAAGRIAMTCDEFGRFQLRDVSPRRFIGARAAGFAPSALEWLASGGLRELHSTRIRLVLGDSGGSLAGTVIDALGTAVPGATVAIRSKLSQGFRLRPDGILLGPSTPIEATTNGHGRFEFADLALDDYELVVRAVGHPGFLGGVRLSKSKLFDDLELRLPAAGDLVGTVSYPDGEPALGAVVIAESGERGFMDLEVDEEGAFLMEGLAAGPIEVQAGFGHSGGGQIARASLLLHPGNQLRWDAVVERSRDYAGRVLGPTGEAISGALLLAVRSGDDVEEASLPSDGDELAAWLAGRKDRALYRQLSQVAADSEGRFTLHGVPSPLAVEVRHPGDRWGWPARVFDPPPEDGVLALSVSDRNSARLSGIVEGLHVEGPAQGEVYAVLKSGAASRVRLDENAAFIFESLTSGSFDVLLWARGYMPRIVATVTLAKGEELELGTLRLSR